MHADLRHFNSAITMSSHDHQPPTPSSPEHQPPIPANSPWIWSGQHGENTPFSPFDPNQRYSGLGFGAHRENFILAGSGGLLLIKRSPPAVGLGQRWQSLMVVNPSTHESRVLPPANSMDVGLEFWSYNGVQSNLLVDTESKTYSHSHIPKLCLPLLPLPTHGSVGNSTRVPHGYPHNIELLANPWYTQIASAYVNGRLFFADVVEDPLPTMNLIEIDVEAGSWKLHNWRFSLQTQFTEFVDTPFLCMRGLTDHGMRQVLNTQTVASRRRGRALENYFLIVECMGELYAVIPMSLNGYLPMSLRSQKTLTEVVYEYANFGLSFMPLQFLIVNMRGDGFVHGVLRILLPEDMSRVYVGRDIDHDNEVRQNELKLMLGLLPDPLDGYRWKISCVAEGSVIWVALYVRLCAAV